MLLAAAARRTHPRGLWRATRATGLEIAKMSLLPRQTLRYSHVGRRPVIFEPARVSLEAVPVEFARTTGFEQTPIVQRIIAKGPLGELSFPIHKGLCWSMKPGQIPTEKLFEVELDRPVFDKMNKYNQKFVRSMWGTTSSILNRMVEGVSEVRYSLFNAIPSFFGRDFKFL